VKLDREAVTGSGGEDEVAVGGHVPVAIELGVVLRHASGGLLRVGLTEEVHVLVNEVGVGVAGVDDSKREDGQEVRGALEVGVVRCEGRRSVAAQLRDHHGTDNPLLRLPDEAGYVLDEGRLEALRVVLDRVRKLDVVHLNFYLTMWSR